MKKAKGFTLIELIIVMAILSILMVGIMQMMKPIRNTFVDSTYYEAQRNTQNGIVTYLSESLRYATNLGIYNEQAGITNLNDALNEFETLTEITDRSKYNVITINNKDPFTYNNETCYGRIVRSKDVTAGTSRLALGDAYYGKYTYSINVEVDPPGGTSIQGLKITVSSLLPSSLKQAKNDGNAQNTTIASGYKCVSTEGEIPCKNLVAPINGKSDATYAGTSTTASGSNTYIIFTLPE
ncbi:MAG: type II secretion system protein [Oscillospiraceae bacterium]